MDRTALTLVAVVLFAGGSARGGDEEGKGSAEVKTIASHESDDWRAADLARIVQGYAITPVALDLRGRNRALVGLGSYLVNAVGSCNDCHTCPSYAPGHNPYDGKGDGKINAGSFLAGGVPFGPNPAQPLVRSANLTPRNGEAEGSSRQQFIETIRTGHDPGDGHLLQVMPWPVLRNMDDRDLSAIYEYISAIPPKDTPPPGTCFAPGS